MKFRTKSVIALPLERKAKYLATLPNMSDTIAARALVNYHLERQRPMMGAFLDALGIAHENGLISEENVAKPDAEKLKARRGGARREVSRRGRVALFQHAGVAGSRDVGGPDRPAADLRRAAERRQPKGEAGIRIGVVAARRMRAIFGGGADAAFDRAVHEALPLDAGVLAGEHDPAGGTAQPVAQSADRSRARIRRSRRAPADRLPSSCATSRASGAGLPSQRS